MRWTLLCLLLVVGCNNLAEKPSAPPTVITVDRPVEVYKKCPVTMPNEPKWCVPADDSDEQWLTCELANAKLMRPYNLELATALRLCAE